MLWRPSWLDSNYIQGHPSVFPNCAIKSVVLGKRPADQFLRNIILKCCSAQCYSGTRAKKAAVLHIPTDSRVLSEDDSIITRIEDCKQLLPTSYLVHLFCFFSWITTLHLFGFFLFFLLLYPSLRVKIALLTSSGAPDASQAPKGSLSPHTSLMLWLSGGPFGGVENLWGSEVDTCSTVLVSA